MASIAPLANTIGSLFAGVAGAVRRGGSWAWRKGRWCGIASLVQVGLTLCSSALAAQADSVAFRDAWYRAPLPGASVTAGYCQVENRGDSTATLVRFASAAGDDFKVEMHETLRTQDGGRMEMVRMRHLQEVEVPSGATVTLAPGGRHLMLFGAPQSGNLTLQATFGDGSVTDVVFEQRMEASSPARTAGR